jgi:hypothetical protein
LNLINGGNQGNKQMNTTNDYGSRSGTNNNNSRDYLGKSNHIHIKVPFEKVYP